MSNFTFTLMKVTVFIVFIISVYKREYDAGTCAGVLFYMVDNVQRRLT